MTRYFLELSNDGMPIGSPVSYQNLEYVFGSKVSEETLLSKNYHPIHNNVPNVSNTQTFNLKGYSKKEDGSFSWDYEVVDLDNDYLINLHIRRKRAYLLADSDWTVLPDSPLTEEQKASWVAYRQALRDMTAQYPEITDVDSIVWPTPPNAPQTAQPE